jgi:hypothetical protein
MLQTWALAPSAPQRCSAELLEGIASLSREHGLPVLTHVYETRAQAAAAQMDTSGSLLDVLARAGLMNDRLGVVHGVWLSPPMFSTTTCWPSTVSCLLHLRRAGARGVKATNISPMIPKHEGQQSGILISGQGF